MISVDFILYFVRNINEGASHCHVYVCVTKDGVRIDEWI
jgi:putative hemolysin